MNVRSQGPRRQRREFQVDTVFLVVKKPEIYIFFISKKPGNDANANTSKPLSKLMQSERAEWAHKR